ncbi:uncharacterized protein LMH87_007589 [Akanthomyces muscarius]|uniref:Myb-like DNA-binding domain-containing protein n=1 Tax=Akanthomyces muscarius TaxID=2231603 RepID=A0A9W8QLY1_AKAMU|nr:uncharacterized protein LMH87_007589 [Akanthomyces muscarius]KAJ4161557.1 hypothetical protein LMH87_007589 [Akanthomyces muscarius]
MPPNANNFLARFLLAILRQTGTKNVNWNQVANDPFLLKPIVSGRAARMRYNRFLNTIANDKPTQRRSSSKNSGVISKSSSPRDFRAKRSPSTESESDVGFAVYPQFNPDVSRHISDLSKDFQSFRPPIHLPSSADPSGELVDGGDYEGDMIGCGNHHNDKNVDDDDDDEARFSAELSLESLRSLALKTALQSRDHSQGFYNKPRTIELQIKPRPHDYDWCAEFHLRLPNLCQILTHILTSCRDLRTLIIVTKSGNHPGDSEEISENEEIPTARITRYIMQYVLLACYVRLAVHGVVTKRLPRVANVTSISAQSLARC